MDLLSLPYEILINNLLSELSLQDFFKLPQTNTTFNNICHDDYLWQLRVQKFYGNYIKPTHLSWKNYYFLFEKTLQIYIDPVPYKYASKERDHLLNLIKTSESGFVNLIVAFQNGKEESDIHVNVIDGKISFQDMIHRRDIIVVINNILQNLDQDLINRFAYYLMQLTNTSIAKNIIMQQKLQKQMVIVILGNPHIHEGELYMYYDGSSWKRLPIFQDPETQDLYVLRDKHFYLFNKEIQDYLLGEHGIEILQVDDILFPPSNLISIPSSGFFIE